MAAFTFAGATAVVTGAASGIGAALARALAARGVRLVLLDKDAERLAAVADTLPAGAGLATIVVDLADPAAIRRAADEITASQPRIDLLVNNAGVALTGRFEEVSLAEFDWVIDVNFRAGVHLTHALLPVLRATPGSHIVNVSSVFGIIAPAGQAAYSASKFAVRGFSEALRHELAGTGMGVTSVHPGGVRTRIAETARVGSGVTAEAAEATRRLAATLLTMEPDRAAAVIVRGIERRQPRVLIGASARVLDLAARLAPASYGRLLAALRGRRRTAEPVAVAEPH